MNVLKKSHICGVSAFRIFAETKCSRGKTGQNRHYQVSIVLGNQTENLKYLQKDATPGLTF